MQIFIKTLYIITGLSFCSNTIASDANTRLTTSTSASLITFHETRHSLAPDTQATLLLLTENTKETIRDLKNIQPSMTINVPAKTAVRAASIAVIYRSAGNLCTNDGKVNLIYAGLLATGCIVLGADLAYDYMHPQATSRAPTLAQASSDDSANNPSQN